MAKKIKKLLWIVVSLLIFNWLLTMIGWSPFGWHYFFPDYYDDVRYWAPAWMDNEHILFMKSVNNWRQETGFLFSDGRRFMDYKTYLCSMKIDGTDKKELIEIKTPLGKWQPEYINYSSNNKILISSTGKIDGGGVSHTGVVLIDLSNNTENMILKEGLLASFSPNGKLVVYIGQGKSTKIMREHIHGIDKEQVSYGNNGIWMMDIDGQNKQQLTDSPKDNHPLISPNDSLVSFERNVEMKDKEIWVMDKKGKGQRKVYEGGLLDWFNDSKHLWTYNGSIDLEGKIISDYDIKKMRTNGVLSPSNERVTTEAYFPKRPVNEDRVLYIGDIQGNRTYEEINYATINYGKRNRKQNNNIWINSK